MITSLSLNPRFKDTKTKPGKPILKRGKVRRSLTLLRSSIPRFHGFHCPGRRRNSRLMRLKATVLDPGGSKNQFGLSTETGVQWPPYSVLTRCLSIIFPYLQDDSSLCHQTLKKRFFKCPFLGCALVVTFTLFQFLHLQLHPVQTFPCCSHSLPLAPGLNTSFSLFCSNGAPQPSH